MRGLHYLLPGLLLIVIACASVTSSPTPTTVTATISTDAVLDDTVAEVFWIAALAFADVPRDTPFELARDLTYAALFQEYDAQLEQIESYGVDPFEDWPYCSAVVAVIFSLGDLNQAESAVEAGPPVNSAAELIYSLSIWAITASQEGKREWQKQESLDLCVEFENKIRDERNLPRRQFAP